MGITAKVNAAAVQAKLDAWVKSAAAKDRAEQKINEYIDSDVRRSDGGSKVLTIAWVNELAEELAGMIEANSSLTASGGGHGISVTASGGGAHKIGSGGVAASIDLSEDGGLGRSSLYTEYPKRVKNIIALFEHGYSARTSVWGYWNGEYTWSLSERDAANFIHEAVDDFNSKYSDLGITVTIMKPYA